ncbi:MerR family transcriptional regulator [Cytobacillus suaedae]|nr:MerR family transcriptional regulator [Cytobacillus suaedae]
MYTIKKVSELVGIPSVTIRAWENRYHIITPHRTEGGHRLYSQNDIDTLLWLRTQIEEEGLKISEAIRLLRQSPEVETSSSSQVVEVKQTTYTDLTEKLYNYLTKFDSDKSNQIIDFAFSMYHYEDVFHKVFVPVLYRAGDEWELGKITVAQEHFASELILQRFTQFFRILPINKSLPKALAFCPEGENHQLGLMLYSLFLRKKAHDVIYLGPNTPFSGLTNLINSNNISIVAISLTNSRYEEQVTSWINECLDVNKDVSFVLGGKGFEQSKTPKNSYVLSADSDWEKVYELVIKKK